MKEVPVKLKDSPRAKNGRYLIVERKFVMEVHHPITGEQIQANITLRADVPPNMRGAVKQSDVESIIRACCSNFASGVWIACC